MLLLLFLPRPPLLLLRRLVVVHSAGVEGEGVGAVDHGRVEDDVDVAVAGNHRRQVLPAPRRNTQAVERLDGFLSFLVVLYKLEKMSPRRA